MAEPEQGASEEPVPVERSSPRIPRPPDQDPASPASGPASAPEEESVPHLVWETVGGYMGGMMVVATADALRLGLGL